MVAPQLASFPPAATRARIGHSQWLGFVKAWSAIIGEHLRASITEFQKLIKTDASVVQFLSSFYKNLALDPPAPLGEDEKRLRQDAILLVHRICHECSTVPEDMLDWRFLADMCTAYPRSLTLKELLKTLWTREETPEPSLTKLKVAISQGLDSKRTTKDMEFYLGRLASLLNTSLDAAKIFTVGSDFIDALFNYYPKASASQRKDLTIIAYQCLVSLAVRQSHNFSLLGDHLYSVETITTTQKSSNSREQTLLENLVTHTPLIEVLAEQAEVEGTTRVRSRIASLSNFQIAGVAPYTRPAKRSKGKETVRSVSAISAGSGPVNEEMMTQKLSLVSQVQDLLPDLGNGFILKLLEEYNDNIELVISHLLEDDIPPHLRDADKSETIPVIPVTNKVSSISSTSPLQSAAGGFIPERRNVYDDDEFDSLLLDTSRVHIGGQNPHLTADEMLNLRDKNSTKDSVLAALAAFDADDDERDDTYDLADVGGAMDASVTEWSDSPAGSTDALELTLFHAFKTSPELFNRDPATRRSQPRQSLKKETGMTDEAIEGWAIMLRRDPRRLSRLEASALTVGAPQRELGRTAYRKGAEIEGSEGEASGHDSRGGHRGRGRGGGRGRGRGRGDAGVGEAAPGLSDDKAAQQERRRNEAHKGSRANHNRKDQQARKMARGGGFPA